MGPSPEHVQIASFRRFETWREGETLGLGDQLSEVARGDDGLPNEVETQESSIRFHLAWEVHFGDSTTLPTVWGAVPHQYVGFVDLAASLSGSTRFSTGFARQVGISDDKVPGSEIDDSIIPFGEATSRARVRR